ncbi:DNA ligase 4 [Marchantia polymorpha subsp. ruderalis]
MCDETVEFSYLASMLDAVVRAKKGPLKRKHVRTFLDHVYTDHEFFSAMRLMLPNLDKERGNYGLKEAVLAKSLAEALCLSKDSEDAQKLLNWRKGGTRAGSNAGNFSFVATEILCRRQRVTSTGIKIKEVNDLLDRLAAADRREEKVAVLGEMINKTNAQEMRWIIMIILKDLKLGISEKTFFSEFHPDAEDLFNVTCDLKLVCDKLRNRNERYDRQDIEVGKAVRPQLAARVANVEEAWKKFRGKQVIVECKFDGDRIQIHKNGSSVNFFSRNFIDHQEFKEGVANLIIQNVLPDKCILDGEMLVWDRSTKRFADFGTNREAAKAAKDGLDTSQQLCYVAFDVLYHGNSSVIHLPLRERQQLLEKSIKPLQGRLELLLPSGSAQPSTGESKWSFIASRAEDVEQFFQQTVENREEGIILKDLDSKWEPTDRSGKWLKLKPDYVHTGSDLDVLIIGGYYGSGRRGGQVAQFLLGLAEPPKPGQYPTRFFSFCKVGTGLTDEESDHLVQRLKPYFRRNEKNSKTPSCYIVTNNAKERPDVWIDQPDKSVIMEITSDIRTIKTEVFAAPYGLRFPRVNRVRYEKPWYDCLDVQALVDMVNSRSGSTVDAKQSEGKENKVKQSKRQKKTEVRFMSLVPSHMRVTDVSHVKRATKIFDGLVFYFANFSEDYAKESLHKLVVENGGSFSMNLNNEVTHALACEKKGIKYMAAATHGDVIHYSWVMDCCTAKDLLPVRPKYFLHLSAQTKNKMKAEIDDYGDYYFLDNDTNDLKQLFENMEPSKLASDKEELAHYKKKYCPSSTFCLFSNCSFYFHKPIHSRNVDSQLVAETALMRQRLEVSMHAGKVIETLTSDVTHMIIYTSPNDSLPFSTIFKSIPFSVRRLLMSHKLKIMSHQWIDDHELGTCGHPPEATYNLRDASFQYNEHEMEVIQPMQLSGNEVNGRATREDVKEAEAMEVGLGTLADQVVRRNRLVTLQKAPRSSKRRSSSHLANEKKATEDKEQDRAAKRMCSKSEQVREELLSSGSDAAELVAERQEAADRNGTSILEDHLRIRPGTSRSIEEDSVDEKAVNDVLEDLIPTLKFSQQQPPSQICSAQVTLATADPRLVINPPPESPSEYSKLTLKALADPISSMPDPATEHILPKPTTKKKVSYKNIVSNLLNNPP